MTWASNTLLNDGPRPVQVTKGGANERGRREEWIPTGQQNPENLAELEDAKEKSSVGQEYVGTTRVMGVSKQKE